MSFTVTIPLAALTEVVVKAARSTEPRAINPLLAHMKLDVVADGIVCSATDYEVALRAHVPAITTGSGCVALPIRILMDVVRGLPGPEVVISGADGRVTLACGRSRFAINTLDATDFPVFPDPEAPAVLTVSGAELRDALSRVRWCASNGKDGRVMLAGVYLSLADDALEFAATDTNRLACDHSVGVTTDATALEAILPTRLIAELLRSPAEEYTLRISDRIAQFTDGPNTHSSRLVEGTFPRYAPLLAAVAGATPRWTAPVKTLRDAIVRAAIASRDETGRIAFSSHDGTLTLTASSASVGEAVEELTVEMGSPEPFTTFFNGSYLRQVLDSVHSDVVLFSANDPVAAGTLTFPDLAAYRYLVMPMRDLG
jgi:DNA polymerase-3 subunit beta